MIGDKETNITFTERGITINGEETDAYIAPEMQFKAQGSLKSLTVTLYADSVNFDNLPSNGWVTNVSDIEDGLAAYIDLLEQGEIAPHILSETAAKIVAHDLKRILKHGATF